MKANNQEGEPMRDKFLFIFVAILILVLIILAYNTITASASPALPLSVAAFLTFFVIFLALIFYITLILYVDKEVIKYEGK